MRIILNLSYPHDSGSVNHSINKETYGQKPMNLTYPTVDSLAKIIQEKGVGYRISKRDFSKAYRQLWNCSSQIMLLGYYFEERYYFDVMLSMGSSSAAYCCQRTTNAVTYIFGQLGYDNVNYLDDLGGAEVNDKADEAYDCLGWIMDSIGM